jgi:hypothetical protein
MGRRTTQLAIRELRVQFKPINCLSLTLSQWSSSTIAATIHECCRGFANQIMRRCSTLILELLTRSLHTAAPASSFGTPKQVLQLCLDIDTSGLVQPQEILRASVEEECR